MADENKAYRCRMCGRTSSFSDFAPLKYYEAQEHREWAGIIMGYVCNDCKSVLKTLQDVHKSTGQHHIFQFSMHPQGEALEREIKGRMILKRLGIQANYVAKLQQEQNCECASCKTKLSEPMLIDYDFKQGKIAKLLCETCS